MLQRFLYSGLRNLIERNPIRLFRGKIQGCLQMPGNGFSLAVRVRCKENFICFFRFLAKRSQNFPFSTDRDIFRLIIMLRIKAELTLRKIADMACRSHDLIILAQKFLNCLDLCRRLNNYQIFRHNISHSEQIAVQHFQNIHHSHPLCKQYRTASIRLQDLRRERREAIYTKNIQKILFDSPHEGCYPVPIFMSNALSIVFFSVSDFRSLIFFRNFMVVRSPILLSRRTLTSSLYGAGCAEKPFLQQENPTCSAQSYQQPLMVWKAER